MIRIPLLLAYLISVLHFQARAQDSLWVRVSGSEIPYIIVPAQQGEHLYDIARRFSVPPAFHADFTDIPLPQSLSAGNQVKVPIGNYNYRRVSVPGQNLPLYLRTQEGDKLVTLAGQMNTSIAALKEMNRLSNTSPATGTILCVGYIAYAPPANPPAPTATSPTPANKVDTTIADTSPEEQLEDSMQVELATDFERQSGTTPLNEESGAAVLFASKAPAKPGVFYAFHNTAPRGSLVKVYNPESDKTIYVKIIGRIPQLKEYNNCIIAIGARASRALGAPYKKAFCKVSF